MASKSALAKKPDRSEEVPEDREITIEPLQAQVNWAGQHWREVFVRAPRDMVSDDLRNPEIWSRVQKGREPMIRFDHLFVIAHDESWYARCIVTYSDTEDVNLLVERVHSFRDPGDEELFSDGTYRVAFEGNGYTIRRVIDNVRMGSSIYRTHDEARGHISTMYPRQIEG